MSNYLRMIAKDGRKVDVPLRLVPMKEREGFRPDTECEDRRPKHTTEMVGRHKGQAAIVIASGPSTGAVPYRSLMEFIRAGGNVPGGLTKGPLRVWATNDVFKCCNGLPIAADYVVILDSHFWTRWLRELLEYFQQFPNALPVLGFSINQSIDYQQIGINLGRPATKTETPEYIPGRFFHGNSSGVAAIQMAMFAGCDPIYLLGHDCGAIYGKTHGSGIRTPEELRKDYPQGKMMLDGYRAVALHAERLGVRIINLSPESRIPDFPKEDVFRIAQP